MTNIVSINFPDIGEGVVEGEVIEWLKKVNDKVKEHEPVVTVMTDKATVELPSPYAGTIVKHYYKEGEVAIRDKPIYDIAVDDASQLAHHMPEKVPLKSDQQKPQQKIQEKPQKNRAQVKTSTTEKALATPAVRKIARDLHIDINQIAGSGDDGRVTAEDIAGHIKNNRAPSREGQRAAPQIQQSTPVLHWDDDEEFPLRGLRNIISEKMVESKYIIPHFSFFDQMDATRIVQMRDKMKILAEKENIKLTYMPFFIRALSLTLKRYPIFNGSLDMSDNSVVIHKHHNIGIAFKTPAGVMAPVLKNVQNLSLNDTIRAYEELKNRAVANKLDIADMKEATITISNFGTLGGLWATPIINYPEVAILGVARIHKEPVVVNDTVAVRDMLNLAWSFDHRIIDGDAAAEFSNYFINLLKNPASLL